MGLPWVATSIPRLPEPAPCLSRFDTMIASRLMQTITHQFLNTLHQGGSYGYWWTLEGHQSFWWEAGKPTPRPNGKRNVYFGVHPSAAIPTTDRHGKSVPSRHVRSQIDSIASCTCLFAEYDAKDFGGQKLAALDHIQGLEPRPSVVVDSGGGYHCYWLLGRSIPLDTPEQREGMRKYQAAWVVLMGGDTAAKDLARVLRVPGTINYKYDPPRPVDFVWCELARTYDPDALFDLAEPFVESGLPNAKANGALTTDQAAQQQASKWLGNAVARVRSAPDGQKHTTLLAAAIALGGLVPLQLLTESEIESTLYAAIEGRAENGKTAQDTIRDGIGYGKAKPWPLDEVLKSNGRAPGAAPATTETTLARADAPPTEYVTAPLEPGQGPVSARIRLALTQAGYTFRLNELDSWVEVNDVRLTDELEAEIIMAARDADVRPIDAVRPFIIAEARRNPYHPIRDYLTSLVWDGQNHIGALCEHLTSSDPPVAYDAGDAPLHSVYVYRWCIGAVAKVFEQGQNLPLVLAGPQDIGKSTLARWLCSGIGEEYFLEMPIDPHDKDNDLRQMRTFIWEIAELDATTRKADMAALKAFITRKTATVRKSYGRYDTTRPTIASFIGTVNKGEGFLSDTTGNRRFLVTTLTAIDRAYTRALDVNQVWAQAVALYRRGEPWRLLPIEQAAQTAANTGHEFDTPLEGWLTSHFEIGLDASYVLSSAEIIDHLRKFYDIRLSGNERSQAMEISRVCQRLGVDRRRLHPQRPFVYLGIRAKLPGETPNTAS